MRDKEVVKLEESLRDFIIDDYEDNRWREEVSSNRSSEMYRYRSLTIHIHPIRNVSPNFRVSIGILEATFNISGGEKTSGALGGNDERLIQKWLSRGSNKTLMMNIWERKTPEKLIRLTPFDFS